MRATKIVRVPSMKNSLPKSDHLGSAIKVEGNVPSPRGVSQNALHTVENPGSDE